MRPPKRIEGELLPIRPPKPPAERSPSCFENCDEFGDCRAENIRFPGLRFWNLRECFDRLAFPNEFSSAIQERQFDVDALHGIGRVFVDQAAQSSFFQIVFHRADQNAGTIRIPAEGSCVARCFIPIFGRPDRDRVPYGCQLAREIERRLIE